MFSFFDQIKVKCLRGGCSSLKLSAELTIRKKMDGVAPPKQGRQRGWRFADDNLGGANILLAKREGEKLVAKWGRKGTGESSRWHSCFALLSSKFIHPPQNHLPNHYKTS